MLIWGFTENSIFRGGWGEWFTKNQYIVRLLKKLGLRQFTDLRGGLAKKKGWCF